MLPNRFVLVRDASRVLPMGDDDDDHDDTNEELAPPKYPFDVSTMECVLDVRALCGLPQDSEEGGAIAFRALLMPKGKTLHIPDEPGCYATLGPWRMQSALALVHFVAATNRKPELLLSCCWRSSTTGCCPTARRLGCSSCLCSCLCYVTAETLNARGRVE